MNIKQKVSRGPTTSGSCRTQQKNLEQMLRDLIEAGRWDLVPKPASLWWTSTYDSEQKVGMSLCTTSGCHKFHSEEKFNILGYAMNPQGKSHVTIEERMQSANEAFWMEILIYRSKDFPWKVKCRRLVDHVYPVFAFGCENWLWTVLNLNKIKGWETKTLSRRFRIKRHKEETWVDNHIRTCNLQEEEAEEARTLLEDMQQHVGEGDAKITLAGKHAATCGRSRRKSY